MAEEKKNISNMREKTHEGVDNVMDKAEVVEEKGRNKIAHMKETAINARQNVDGHIQRNPERSVLIAAGVGVAAGAIIARTIARRKK